MYTCTRWIHPLKIEIRPCESEYHVKRDSKRFRHKVGYLKWAPNVNGEKSANHHLLRTAIKAACIARQCNCVIYVPIPSGIHKFTSIAVVEQIFNATRHTRHINAVSNVLWACISKTFLSWITHALLMSQTITMHRHVHLMLSLGKVDCARDVLMVW